MAVSHGPSSDGFAAILHQTCLHADPERHTPQRQADGEAQLKKAKKPNISRRVLATARCHRHGDEQGGQQSKEPNKRIRDKLDAFIIICGITFGLKA